MKVFISWSGDRSRAVADLMSVWIKCVLQASEPWISTKHIDRGALWFSEINEKLRDVSVGIVCLTMENKDKPWILFETGALAKGLSSNRVCTFLVDLEPGDLTDPLAQFNHTRPDKAGVWELVRTLNSCMGERSLDNIVLERAFEVYWPSFEEDFAKAVDQTPSVQVKPRPQSDLLMEILETTRVLNRRIGKLEGGSDYVYYPKNNPPKLNVVLSKIDSLVKAGATESEVRRFIASAGLRPSELDKALDVLGFGFGGRDFSSVGDKSITEDDL